MHLVYQYLFVAMWVGFGLYWRATSGNVKANAWRESWTATFSHMVPLVVAGLLLWLPSVGFLDLNRRLWPRTIFLFWAGATLTAIGLVISVWARIYLGRNWSGIVTLKADHELVSGGPYAFVRHPIYTGLLLAFLGSAIARDDWQGILAVVIAALTFWMKLRREESGMRTLFGSAYEVYARKVAALIPFVL